MHQELDQKRDQKRDQTEERKARDQEPKRKKNHQDLDQKRDQKRDQTEERKARDQDPKRKKMHSEIDRKRDKTPKRRTMHQKIDQIRDQNKERIFLKKTKDSLRYQKKMQETFGSETGFDVICSSCLQYKSLQYCKPVTILSHEAQRKFIVKYCALLKDRSNDQHVCNMCLKDIKRNKTPKRNNKSKFKFANFPRYLIKKLKKICKVKQNDMPICTDLDDENFERQALQLNRLESYLLKLVIPFIRVIHCPRGIYFKVKVI